MTSKPVRKTYVAQLFGDGMQFKNLTRAQKNEYFIARKDAGSKRPHRRTGATKDQDTTVERDEILEEEQTLVQELFGYNAKVRTLTAAQYTEYLRVLDGRRDEPRLRHRAEARNTLCERMFGKGARKSNFTEEQLKEYYHLVYIRKLARAQTIIPDDETLPTNFIDITNDTVHIPSPKKLKWISVSAQ